VQPAYAEETQHGSFETDSNTVTTPSSDHGTEHGYDPHANVNHSEQPLTIMDHHESENSIHHESSSDHHAGDDHHGDTGHHAGYHPPAPYVVPLGPSSVHLNTLIMTYVVMAVLIGLTVSATRNLKKKPGKKQVFFESLVDLAHAIVKTQITHNTYKYIPLIGTIFLFILVSNWMGLFPLRIVELFGTPYGFELAAPTNDLNTNGAIALIAVASYFFFGIQKKGLSHFKHYLKPMPFMLPLNLMEDISRPLSLSFRLFGNILGGEIVLGILIFLTAPLIITSVVVLPIMVLKVLVGFIQAYIFAMLTISYIGGMVADHH